MITKKKILVLVDSIDVNDSSGTKGRVALIKNLAKTGGQVVVYHYSQKEINLDDIGCFNVDERKFHLNFILSRIHRLINRWFKIELGNLIDTLFGFSFGFYNDANSMSKAIEKLDPEMFDMCWTLSKGNSYRPHKAILSQPKWHSRWYAYVHDPYPQQLYPRPYNYVPAGYKQKRNFFRKITQKAEKVVFPSLLLKEWMQSYYIDLSEKSIIIPHQISDQTMVGSEVPSYFDTEKFNILHGGNLLDLRNPKSIVEAFLVFLERNKDARVNSALFFLGKKSAFSDYLATMCTKTPQLYISDGYVAFEDVYKMQQMASINIILEATSEISPFLPGKFAHCVGSNRPIFLIGPHYSESRRLLGDSYPYSFDFSDVDKIALAMEELYVKWQKTSGPLMLDRPDLKHYLSIDFLKESLQGASEKMDA